MASCLAHWMCLVTIDNDGRAAIRKANALDALKQRTLRKIAAVKDKQRARMRANRKQLHTAPRSAERKQSQAEIDDYLARNPVKRW